MTPALTARILEGRPEEERLLQNVNVPEELPESLPSLQGPDTSRVQAPFSLLAQGTEVSEGTEPREFLGTRGPELSRLEPYPSLPEYTA